MTKLPVAHSFKRSIWVLVCLIICSTGNLSAEENNSAEMEGDLLPGVTLAQGISQMTGVAISPLLGVSAIGAWKYYRTEESKRHLLPWFCKPVFWGIGLSVLALIFLKDSIGAGAPRLVKKPLDLLELFEGKFSAVIASTAFVPFVTKQMELHFSSDEAVAAAAGSGEVLATISLSSSMHWLLLPICMVGFLMVWIVSHAINVLILLSPFGLIDVFLKFFRIALLSSIAILYSIHPVLAAIVSGILIVIAAFLAPSAFRLSLFGTVMSVDYVLSIFRKKERIEPVYGFLAKRGSNRMKTRTFGRVERIEESERLVFRSRYLFIGPTRSLELPEDDRISISRGLLFPSVSAPDSESGKTHNLVNLLPRFRGRVEETAEHLAVSEILDSTISRGMKAMFVWLKEMLRSGRDRIADMAETVVNTAKQKSLPAPTAGD